MRILLISDIHGNMTALEAVLNQTDLTKIDQVICLGDTLSGGPQPQEVLDCLKKLQAKVVTGNTDHRLLNPIPTDGLDEHVRMLVEIEAWIRERVSADDLSFLAETTLTHELEAEGLRLLFSHGSPHSFGDRVWPYLSDEEIEQLLSGFQFDVFAGGHTHRSMLRRLGKSLVINPGTVGSPIELGPLAQYALLEIVEGKLSVTFHEVEYDVRPAIAAAHERKMPHSQWWGSRW